MQPALNAYIEGVAPSWPAFLATPDWLDLDPILPLLFGGEREPAQAAYRELVLAKIGGENRPWEKLTNRLYCSPVCIAGGIV